MLGKTISHYRILGELGRGGMGVVYEAEDPRLGRHVALKILSSDLAREPQAVKGFEREARAASALNHPNICTVHDVGDHEGTPFLVMEQLVGMTLQARLARGPLGAGETLEMALAVASALEAAGAMGIVHRDLKPANIFLSTSGITKILDFGIARMAAGPRDAPEDEPTRPRLFESDTGTGKVSGTLRYMSPEQLRGEPLDARTDLFSFGVTLYEATTGRHPFAAASRDLIADAILHRAPPTPGADGLGPVPEFRELIERALKKDPRLRWQTAADLRAELLHIRSLLDAPTARTSVAAWTPPIALPVSITSFVGRAAELQRVGEALGRARLVTLTGPGGTGKTRLALRAAELAAPRYPDGVFFVALGALSDPELVDSAIARAAGLREVPGITLAEQLTRHFSTREALLVLDNFEQILPAGLRIAELLQEAPRLQALVTSRELLRLSAELEVAVPPLGLLQRESAPDSGVQETSESVALFCERAAAVKPGFVLGPEDAAIVAGICARLDGLPLAIELAAARVRYLTPTALLKRLSNRLELLTGGARDLPARQQTLRQAIGWSHDLLSSDERTLFSRLAVFNGGFTLEAAEAVSGAMGPLDLGVLDGIVSLVDKSLIRPATGDQGPRYSMLETIREFGIERLAASGEEPRARRAHAAHFAGLSTALGRDLFSARRAVHLNQLRTEQDNVRAALSWSTSDGGDATLGQIIAGELRHFWVMANCLWEGATALRAVLGQRGREPSRERAVALATFGLLLWFLGEHEQAVAVLEESLELLRGLGDEAEIALALEYLAVANESRGRHAEARRLITESAACYLRLGDQHGRAFALVSAVEPDDLDEARRDCEEALTVLRAHGDEWGASRALRNLGVVAYRGGDFAEARRRFEQCLSLQRELGSRWLISRSLNTLGDIARCEQDVATAQAHYEGSRAEEQADGSRANAVWSLAGLGHVALARGNRGRAEELFVEALSVRPVSSEKSEHVASVLVGLAETRRLAGDTGGAAEVLRVLAPLIDEAHRRMPPIDVTFYRRCLDAMSATPGPAALEPSPGDPSLTDLVRRMCETPAKRT